jgi:hypothetical protein
VAVAARAGPERVGAREKALLKELGCGMRMGGAHRHERKLGKCTPAILGGLRVQVKRSERAGFEK